MCVCVICVDPVGSGEAHSEGREGKRADQGAARAEPLRSTLRLQTKQLRRRSEPCTSHPFGWNVKTVRAEASPLAVPKKATLNTACVFRSDFSDQNQLLARLQKQWLASGKSTLTCTVVRLYREFKQESNI